jgi:site-specific DNA-methyltransferase (adenine-specific)
MKLVKTNRIPSDARRFPTEGGKRISLNAIYCEDCLMTLKRLPDASVDEVVTSPPYDSLRGYAGLSFTKFKEIAKELARVLKPGGVICWNVGDQTERGSESGTSFRQALYFKEIGLNLHDTMIYEKSGFAFPSTNRYHQVFEYIFILSKGKPKSFNPIKDRQNRYVGVHGGEQSYRGEYGARTNVWRYANGGNHTDRFSSGHPAPMPEDLARDLILSFSNPGDLIYDCFAGSGTTVAEAEKLGRSWIASEISEEYSELIKRRIEAAKRQVTKSKDRPFDGVKKAA